jgi:hypothetical protein
MTASQPRKRPQFKRLSAIPRAYPGAQCTPRLTIFRPLTPAEHLYIDETSATVLQGGVICLHVLLSLYWTRKMNKGATHRPDLDNTNPTEFLHVCGVSSGRLVECSARR